MKSNNKRVIYNFESDIGFIALNQRAEDEMKKFAVKRKEFLDQLDKEVHEAADAHWNRVFAYLVDKGAMTADEASKAKSRSSDKNTLIDNELKIVYEEDMSRKKSGSDIEKILNDIFGDN